MMKGDLFELRSAQAMLLTESDPFDSKDHLFELKLDGIRALAYLDAGVTDLRNKRNKYLNPYYPELNELHQYVNKRCITDGELVVMSNGKPDFFDVQKRSLMTDRFKIELAAKQKPVLFVAYDILYVDDHDLLELPLIKRKDYLQETITESPSLSITRHILHQGIDFYQAVASQDLEGVVAKRLDSMYQMGKRSKYWVKFKHMLDEDFIICGYVPDESGLIRSLVLGAYYQGELINQGHVALGIGHDEAKKIVTFATHHKTTCPFKGCHEQEAIWMEPQLVCSVKFMMRTHQGGLRQPVYKGLREDKRSKDCLYKPHS
jgi:bifunctional non-homologous end joining protein LigD